MLLYNGYAEGAVMKLKIVVEEREACFWTASIKERPDLRLGVGSHIDPAVGNFFQLNAEALGFEIDTRRQPKIQTFETYRQY